MADRFAPDPYAERPMGHMEGLMIDIKHDMEKKMEEILTMAEKWDKERVAQLRKLGAERDALAEELKDSIDVIALTDTEATESENGKVEEEGHNTADVKEEQPLDISGMREQILANAAVLHLIWHPDRGDKKSADRPKLHLVTIRESSGVHAAVVYQPRYQGDATQQEKLSLSTSQPMASTRAALESLLDHTAALLCEKRSHLDF